MPEKKYRFNPKTMNFEPIRISGWKKARRTAVALTPGLLLGVIGIFLAFQFIDSPKEGALRRENQQLIAQYDLLDKRMDRIAEVLKDVRRRDDNVYRVIFEADPLPETMRRAGVGGTDRFKDLEGYASSELVIDTRKRLDALARQLVVQSGSLDEVAALALKKQEMLTAIPSVQPIPSDRCELSSGFGVRIHPILKISKMHEGLDFTCNVGTEVRATGDGTVLFAEYNTSGFGIHVVIDHGFGYETVYAHMSQAKVRKGQHIKRGDLLGMSGNTGLSSGPHLHYEVRKDGVALDPANYIFSDLTPQEYALMIEKSRNAGQSLD